MLKVDLEFQSYLRRLREAEYGQLEASLIASGCREPLIVWHDIILDGHHRFEICTKHGISFETHEIDFPDRQAALAWMLQNQLGRRNCTLDEFAYYLGKLYEGRKRQGERTDLQGAEATSGTFYQKSTTAAIVAAEHGVSEKTVRNAAEFASNVDRLAEAAGPEVRRGILSGEVGLTRQDVKEAAQAVEAHQQELTFPNAKAVEVWWRGQKAAQREHKWAETQAYRAELAAREIAVPTGKYRCIVIDPPWSIERIRRDERPNQVGFDYPTMDEEQLREFPLPDLAADDCHLYLWTTQKFLPMALRLAEHWGFRYQCLLTWVKNVGFTPFSWMYSTEHVLFCRRGNLDLLVKGKRLDFSAKVREHSRKPDEFYALVHEVSPGPRIDVFSREKRDGFDQYGNETDKFTWQQAG